MNFKMAMLPYSVPITSIMRSLIVAGFIALSLTGCSKEHVVEYRVPKETSKAAILNTTSRPTAHMPVNMDQQGGILGLAETERFKARAPTWQVPENWEVLAPTSMRKGNFVVQDYDMQAEVTVLEFPGAVGGKLANINRWAAQIAMHELTQAVIDKFDVITVDEKDGIAVELIGAKLQPGKAHPQSIQGVIVELDDGTWFLR